MEKYCENCKQSLPSGLGAMFNKQKSYQFEDGTYCEECAKKIVAKRRRVVK